MLTAACAAVYYLPRDLSDGGIGSGREKQSRPVAAERSTKKNPFGLKKSPAWGGAQLRDLQQTQAACHFDAALL
jgi:hypothetical protein